MAIVPGDAFLPGLLAPAAGANPIAGAAIGLGSALLGGSSGPKISSASQRSPFTQAPVTVTIGDARTKAALDQVLRIGLPLMAGVAMAALVTRRRRGATKN